MINTPLPPPSKKAIFESGSRGSALLLHGFTGTPYDVSTISIALKAHGFGSSAPLLPGHGTNPLDLNKVKAKSWIEAAEKAFNEMDDAKPRFIIGLSMGALLAAILAARHPKDVRAIVLLAPAFHLQFWGSLAISLSKLGLHKVFPLVHKIGGKSDVKDPEGQMNSPCYKDVPLKGLLEFDRLRKDTVSYLPKITCPALVAFGQADLTVNTDKSYKETEKLGSSEIVRISLPLSHHILPIDVERDQLIRYILKFCECHCV